MWLFQVVVACSPPAVRPPPAAAPSGPLRLATLDVPGPSELGRIARDVLEVANAIDPSLAASAGLFDDAARVPRLDEAHLAPLIARLDADLTAMRGLPWRTWDVHAQVDLRWLYAVAETTRHAVVVERSQTHRPAQWLEPVSNVLIAFASYVPERPELQDRVLAEIPAMLDEMRAVCVEPTARDLEAAIPTARALAAMATERGATDVAAALEAYAVELEGVTPDRDFAVVGAEAYAWRWRHQLLLPSDPEEMVARADQALAEVEARLAALPPRAEPPPPTPEQRAAAEALDRDGYLAMYQGMADANRAATVAGGWVSVPDAVGPLRVRETPEAMRALSGDGGSMNPPPPFGSDVGWWNVGHFSALDTPEARLEEVRQVADFHHDGFGPYSVHEGIPGHHLQLSVARLQADPLRSVLQDMVTCEGWGLYAEEVFWAHGGMGDDPRALATVLASERARILRVKTDVWVETGRWTLEEAAAWRRQSPGAPVDDEVLRAVNWPTQLVSYFVGKELIVRLREEVRARRGDGFDERAFHDELLAGGTLPLSLLRAEMLGEPVPDLDAVAAH